MKLLFGIIFYCISILFNILILTISTMKVKKIDIKRAFNIRIHDKTSCCISLLGPFVLITFIMIISYEWIIKPIILRFVKSI